MFENITVVADNFNSNADGEDAVAGIYNRSDGTVFIDQVGFGGYARGGDGGTIYPGINGGTAVVGILNRGGSIRPVGFENRIGIIPGSSAEGGEAGRIIGGDGFEVLGVRSESGSNSITGFGISGTHENDTLNFRNSGGEGTFLGFRGDDIIVTGFGNDRAFGHRGDDEIRLYEGVYVNPINFQLDGDRPRDVAEGGEGDDLIVLKEIGGQRSHRVDGGAGADTLVFEGSTTIGVDLAVTDFQRPAAGLTLLINEIENVTAGSGDDTLIGDGGANALRGSGGNDALVGRGGNDTLEGGSGNDTLQGDAGVNVANGGSGEDFLQFFAPDTSFSFANAGGGIQVSGGGETTTAIDIEVFAFSNTSLTFAEAQARADASGPSSLPPPPLPPPPSEVIRGTPGPDELTGGPGAQTIFGLRGDDVISGGGGRDLIRGGGGDEIRGGGGPDTISGGGGRDLLIDGGGGDALDGGGGRDTVEGGGGRDRVDGGRGRDRIEVSDSTFDDLTIRQIENDALIRGRGFAAVLTDTDADTLNEGLFIFV